MSVPGALQLRIAAMEISPRTHCCVWWTMRQSSMKLCPRLWRVLISICTLLTLPTYAAFMHQLLSETDRHPITSLLQQPTVKVLPMTLLYPNHDVLTTADVDFLMVLPFIPIEDTYIFDVVTLEETDDGGSDEIGTEFPFGDESLSSIYVSKRCCILVLLASDSC